MRRQPSHRGRRLRYQPAVGARVRGGADRRALFASRARLTDAWFNIAQGKTPNGVPVLSEAAEMQIGPF